MSNDNYFFPLSNKLTVKLLPKELLTAGGIIKADNVQEPLKGIVIDKGRGTPLINSEGAWAIVPLECDKGDIVIMIPNVGLEMEVNGENVLLITEDHILFRSPK